MAFEDLMDQLSGSWEGEYLLWLNPEEGPLRSRSKAEILKKANSKVISMEYNWEYEGNNCEGILIISFNRKQEEIVMSWVDSWHQYPEIMISRGILTDGNHVSAKGSYKVSKGPNWEWRTKIIPKSEDEFIFEMYNIHPAGLEQLAVQVKYHRISK